MLNIEKRLPQKFGWTLSQISHIRSSCGFFLVQFSGTLYQTSQEPPGSALNQDACLREDRIKKVDCSQLLFRLCSHCPVFQLVFCVYVWRKKGWEKARILCMVMRVNLEDWKIACMTLLRSGFLSIVSSLGGIWGDLTQVLRGVPYVQNEPGCKGGAQPLWCEPCVWQSGVVWPVCRVRWPGGPGCWSLEEVVLCHRVITGLGGALDFRMSLFLLAPSWSPSILLSSLLSSVDMGDWWPWFAVEGTLTIVILAPVQTWEQTDSAWPDIAGGEGKWLDFVVEVGRLSQLNEHEVILGGAMAVVPVADNLNGVNCLLCAISDSDPEISQHHFQVSGRRRGWE